MQKKLVRIMEEYERIAFGEDEEIKISDRIRALEKLRELLDDQEAGAGVPELVIRIEYV